MAMKAMPAGGNDGILELQDHLRAQTRGVRQVAGRSAHCGHQTVVRIHMHLNLMG